MSKTATHIIAECQRRRTDTCAMGGERGREESEETSGKKWHIEDEGFS